MAQLLKMFSRGSSATGANSSLPTSFYELTAKDAQGQELSMSAFRGQVVLVVNVASKCGFTGQYQDLQRLYSKYHDQGFTVIGAPCNQFGQQEPGTEAEIVQFCSRKYDVTFPILSKLSVNGADTHPLYVWLKSQKTSLGMEAIKWNFEKFLIDRNGQVAGRFTSMAGGSHLEPEIQKLLAQQPTQAQEPAGAEPATAQKEL